MVRARGFEASAAGKLTDQWQIIASYTYINAQDHADHGRRPSSTTSRPITPEHTLLAVDDLRRDADELQVGGGAFYIERGRGATCTNTGARPGLLAVRRHGGLQARRKDTTLQFNVYNLTDKYYYASAYTNWVVPGPSRARPPDLAHAILITDRPADIAAVPRWAASAQSRLGRSTRHDGAHPQGADARAGGALPRRDGEGGLGRRQRHRRPSVRARSSTTCNFPRSRRRRASSATWC